MGVANRFLIISLISFLLTTHYEGKIGSAVITMGKQVVIYVIQLTKRAPTYSPYIQLSDQNNFIINYFYPIFTGLFSYFSL